MPLTDKVVLITGGTGALGRRLIDAFSQSGATVAFCARDFNRLYPIEQRLVAAGRRAVALPCDVRYDDEVVRLIHRVVDRFGRIDCLINAASVVGPRAPIVDYPLDPWRDVLATNLTGVYFTCREVLPWMTRQRAGSIVNVTSAVVPAARPGWGAFVASKCGLEGLTRMLAEEVRESGVRVNLVDFGTPRLDKTAVDLPDSAAAPFLWLADDASAAVSGRRLIAAEFNAHRPL